MGNEKKIKIENVVILKNPLEQAKNVKVDPEAIARWKEKIQVTQKITFDSKKAKTNLEKAGQINKPSLGAISDNKKIATAKDNAQVCSNFCRSRGFNILPLRYAVTIDRKSPLPTNLGQNVKDIKIGKFGYTTKILSEGYIYCLTKRAKSGFKGNWAGYKITPQGYLSYFVVANEKAAPVNVPEFACNNPKHKFAASLITIESRPSDPATKAYIIYTHSPISDAKRAEYEKNADTFASQGKWQSVKIGGSDQPHCFGLANIDKAIYNLSSLGEARITKMKELFKTYTGAFACIGLYDAIGITRDLNNARNELSFKSIKTFLDYKDPKTKITNEHKLHTMTTIDGLEQALQRNFVSVKLKASESMDKVNDSGVALLEQELARAQKNGNYVQVEYLKNKIKEKEKIWAQNKEKLDDYYKGLGVQKGTDQWNNKYSKLLDIQAYNNFKEEFTNKSASYEAIASSYANDHIAWLGSKSLRDALYIFDTKILVPFGFYYHVLVSDLIKGMSGNKVSYDFLTKWLVKDKVDAENLYLKAYCFNIKDIENKFDAAMNEGKLSDWENSLSIGKGLIGAFTAADAAWDNWVNNPQLKESMASLQATKAGFAFHWLSESMKYVIDRTPKVGISGKYPIEFARWLFILRARTGALADKFGVNYYFYGIDYKIWKASSDANLSSKGQTTAKKWFDYRLQEAIDDVTSRANSSSNRVAAIVTFFEFLNFMLQREKANEEGKKDFEFISQYNAATMSLLGASLDMTGSWFQDSRWNVTGGLKAGGAIFATMGGTLGAYLDYQSMKKETNLTLYVILFTKVALGFGAALSGGFIALSLTANVVAKKLPWLAFKQITQKLIEGAAYRIALTAIGKINIYGIAITVAEIFIRKFFFDDALEKWCKQCAFRTKKDNAENLFKDVMAESKAFEMAIGSNLG